MPAPKGNKNAQQAPEHRRSERIPLLVTPSEKAQVESQANRKKQTVSTYIRNKLGL